MPFVHHIRFPPFFSSFYFILKKLERELLLRKIGWFFKFCEARFNRKILKELIESDQLSVLQQTATLLDESGI